MDESSGDKFASTSTDSELYVQARLDGTVDRTDGVLQLWTKQASDKTYSKKAEVGTSVNYQSQTYYVGTQNDIGLIDEGSQDTITIDGSEVTLEVVNVQADEDVEVSVSGSTAETYSKGEYFTVNGDKIIVTSTFYSDSVTSNAGFAHIDQINLATGNIDLKLNRTYDSETTRVYYNNAGGRSIDAAPQHSKNSTLGSDFLVNVVQPSEGDYNVSLVNNANGNTVSTFYSNPDEGLLELYNDNFYGVNFYNPLTKTLDESVPLPTAGSSFWSQASTNYEYYFKVEDLEDDQTTDQVRNTEVFTASTSGDSTNALPTVENMSAYVNDSYVNLSTVSTFNTSVEAFQVCVSDPDNELFTANASLIAQEDGRTVYSDKRNTGFSDSCLSWNQSNSEIPMQNLDESGSWKFNVSVSEGINTVTDSRMFSVEWGEIQIDSFSVCGQTSLVEIVQGNSCQVDLQITCSGPGECKPRLWLDPVLG